MHATPRPAETMDWRLGGRARVWRIATARFRGVQTSASAGSSLGLQRSARAVAYAGHLWLAGSVSRYGDGAARVRVGV